MKLSIKIALLLAILIFGATALFLAVFVRNSRRDQERTLGEESLSTMRTLSSSVETVLENANSCSKILLGDNLVQAQMRSGNLFGDLSGQSHMLDRVYTILQLYPTVSAVWLVDNHGQMLSIGEHHGYSSGMTAGSVWEEYRSMRQAYGTAQVVSIPGTIGQMALLRSYNDLESFQSLGLVGVDVDTPIILEALREVIRTPDDAILILDAQEHVLYQTGRDLSQELISEGRGSDGYSFHHLNGERFLFNTVQVANSGWQIRRATKLDQDVFLTDSVRSNLIMLIVLCVCLFAGSYAIAGILIRELVEKQRRIRTVELNEIQEQMKPHFLYNTLESIEALAMMGEIDKVCQLVESLGMFYRTSVSGGREFLTVEEEMRIAEKYADIMHIRFGDSFNCHISMDQECRSLYLPKLTIQPLVENSFQHGIRNKIQYGQIYVTAAVEQGRLHIMIQDNGEGIPNDVIEELDHNGTPEKGRSLGLRGTIERLRLLYDKQFEYRIENKGYSQVHLFLDTQSVERGYHDHDEREENHSRHADR